MKEMNIHNSRRNHLLQSAVRSVLALALLVSSFLSRPAIAERDFRKDLPRIPAHEPNEVLSTFEHHPDFKLELVASEPLVHDPVAVDFDQWGRMFVVEMRGYSEDGELNIGRVVRLTDIDRDGFYDERKVFIDNLSWPTAVFCYGDDIIVGVAPDILYCRDTDRDGVVDEIERLYTGFPRNNVQGLLNSFSWGLDNRIHGSASGNGGVIENLKVKDRPSVKVKGMDFAIDPQTWEFEATSGGAQHGLSFDDWGNKFVSQNSDHIQMVMYEARYLQRNPNLAAPGARLSIAADGPQAEVFRISPVEPWRTIRTRLRVDGDVPGPIEGGGRAAGYFTGSTGITIYRGDQWPDQYKGQAFVGDVGSNIVHRKRLHRQGVRFVATRATPGKEFVASKDIWFRPAQFANSPDGVLYILDVYREVIEHPDSLPPVIKKHLDLTSGRDRGRIYRVIPNDFQQPEVPVPGEMNSEELVQLLEHPNAWHREMASRILFRKQDKTIIKNLRELANSSDSPLGRMHAAYALAGLDALDEKVLTGLLKDTHPRVREHAVRLSESFTSNARIRDLIHECAKDDDIRVRYQTAFTLGEFDDVRNPAALVSLLKDDKNDSWVRMAVLSSAHGQIHNLFHQLWRDPAFVSGEKGLLILEELAQQIAREGDESLAFVVKQLADSPDAMKGKVGVVLTGLSVGLGRSGGAFRTKLHGVAPDEDVSGLIGDVVKPALEISRNRALEDLERIPAIKSLRIGDWDTVSPLLKGLVHSGESRHIQRTALRTLTDFRKKTMGEELIGLWRSTSIEVRGLILNSLLSRIDWTNSLLDAIDKGMFHASHLDALQRQRLRLHSNSSIRLRARSMIGQTNRDRQAVVEAYQVSLSMKGDRIKGKSIFVDKCSKCHRLENEGYEIGPNLAAVKNRGMDTVLLQLLDPNREINPEFVNFIVTKKNGETFSGIIKSESPSAIELALGAGERELILRSDIQELRPSGISMMPEQLEVDLDVKAMSDLLAYIEGLR